MLVELHMLQNFAPSNLNRDDTGAPKDCEFGGHRRARISSQCQKRAIRELFERQRLFDSAALGARTKRLRDAVMESLAAKGVAVEDADRIAATAVRELGLKFEKKNPRLTEYLVFLGRRDIERLKQLCFEHRGALLTASASRASDDDLDDEEDSPKKRRKKRNQDEKLPIDLKQSIWGGREAVDVALFGRMLANLPDFNRCAACQVAHALSTNAVSVEFDFFTAVDDLKPPSEDAGAGMLGTVEFNSSCYYRYANVDMDQLGENLGGDDELVRATVRAFLQAAVAAVPTGKQNSFAAHNPPSLVMGVVRERGPWSLANAFVRPVAPRHDGDLIGASIAALDGYWGRLTAMYGADGITERVVCLDPAYAGHLENLAPHRIETVAALIGRIDRAAG